MLLVLFLQVGVGFLAQYLIKPMLGFAIVMVFFVLPELFHTSLSLCFV